MRLGRGCEHHNVTSLRALKFVTQFVRQQEFAIVEIGVHGTAIDLMGLGDD